MYVTTERLPKGQLKMTSLTAEIRTFWEACGSVPGRLAPGTGLELTSFDQVIISLDHALTTIRTLDLEVLQKSDPAEYLKLRTSDPQGQSVRALTGPRNNAVHGMDIVDPDIASALAVPDTSLYIINPRWKATADVPTAMFHNQQKRVDTKLELAYTTAAAGRPILDTLLDSVAFFERCDPRLAKRDPVNNLAGFPLTPYPVANRYRRLHPDWSSESDWDVELRRKATGSVPGGIQREILGRVAVGDQTIVCGWTIVDKSRNEAFTESIDQVSADIAKGYQYFVLQGSESLPVIAAASGLLAGTVPFLDLPLSSLETDSHPWKEWWKLVQDDADLYRRQRIQL